MKLAVAFAALVSVFTFSSCLDSGESGPGYRYDNVTITSNMGIPLLLSDAFPGVTYTTDAYDLSAYGIPSNTKRAWIAYTIPEGTDLTQQRIKINLVKGMCSSADDLTSVLSAKQDSCNTYTSKIYSFIDKGNTLGVGYLYYPRITAMNGYLNVGFRYAVEKSGKVLLEENRIGNDTLYVDFRVQADIKESAMIQSDWRSFDLSRGNLIYDVVPKNSTRDSIYITVVAETTQDNRVLKDSLTVFTKSMR